MRRPFPASLLAEWQAQPREVRCAPATHGEIEAFEAVHGPIPAEYRQFLLQFGGGMVGSEWLDGIDQLPSTHAKFNAECGPDGWNMPDVFAIGWDGAGNPIAIDGSGAVVVADPNFGAAQEVAHSFSEFLSKGLGHEL